MSVNVDTDNYKLLLQTFLLTSAWADAKQEGAERGIADGHGGLMWCDGNELEYLQACPRSEDPRTPSELGSLGLRPQTRCETTKRKG